MSPLRGSLHGVIIFYYCNVIPSGLWFVTAETRMNVTPSGLASLGQLTFQPFGIGMCMP